MRDYSKGVTVEWVGVVTDDTANVCIGTEKSTGGIRYEKWAVVHRKMWGKSWPPGAGDIFDPDSGKLMLRPRATGAGT